MSLSITGTRRGSHPHALRSEPAGLRDAMGPPAQVVRSPAPQPDLKKKKKKKKSTISLPVTEPACQPGVR